MANINKDMSGYQCVSSLKATNKVMLMGTEMVPEMLVIFNE
jgi:hypothetical protein